jgi:hypothetical protein
MVIINVALLDLVNFKFVSKIMGNCMPLTTTIQRDLGVGGNYGTGGGGDRGGENQANAELQIEDKKVKFVDALIYTRSELYFRGGGGDE